MNCLHPAQIQLKTEFGLSIGQRTYTFAELEQHLARSSWRVNALALARELLERGVAEMELDDGKIVRAFLVSAPVWGKHDDAPERPRSL